MEHMQEMSVPVHLHKSITAKVNLPLFKKLFFSFYLVKILKRNGYQTYHLKILQNTYPCVGLVLYQNRH
jgi:hypothetical protein